MKTGILLLSKKKYNMNEEKTTPRVYKYWAKLANEYNEKHNIPTRYEILT